MWATVYSRSVIVQLCSSKSMHWLHCHFIVEENDEIALLLLDK